MATEHTMKLHPSPFEKIKSGEKTIELRLYDEKRRQIRVGDDIIFTNTATGETLKRTVYKLHCFDSFESLYQSLPLLQCGYTPENIHRASPADMRQYYSMEDQRKYGVVGIELKSYRKNKSLSMLWIIIMLLTAFIAGFFVGRLNVDSDRENRSPSYESKASIYINVRSTGDENSETSTNSQDLRLIYERILQSSSIRKEIDKKFPDSQYELSLENVSGNLYEIIVTGKDKDNLKEICNTVLENFPSLVHEIIPGTSVKVVDFPSAPM